MQTDRDPQRVATPYDTTMKPQKSNLAERRRERLVSLLSRAERQGARWQFWVTSGAILGVAILFAALSKWDAAFGYSLSILAFFLLVNLLNYLLVRRGLQPIWLGLVLGTLNIVVLTVVVVAPNPFHHDALPQAMMLREGGFKYLLIFVCLGALTLSPRLAAWLGTAAALCWTAAILWVIAQPGTIVAARPMAGISVGERLRLHLNPHFVDIVEQATNIAVILIIAGIIAAVVARTRALAEDYTRAERARFNLARHFSPNVVDALAAADEPFGPVRRQEVAVLFADIVGFTNYAEEHPAEQVFEMLREFHRRMEQVVFDNGGTVDNYIGDCIMATFGIPRPSDDDATHALRCARAMRDALDLWNHERQRAGFAPVDVRIGCQYGPVVLGAIGSERNLSFAVIGDTCNVASRLQVACRELDASICVGDALVRRVAPAGGDNPLAGLVQVEAVSVRGRDASVDVWILPG
jgi:adenylate cyclase